MSSPQARKLVEYLSVNGIQSHDVLDAIRRVPREYFVSEAMMHQAYDNNALPIAHGQTISQPYMVAKMTELLELNSDSRVLEIGTGSGYQTAILAQLVDKVYSIERIKSLQWEAKRRLKQLDIYNVATKHGDGWEGWPARAPFDAIIVTAAASEIPHALLDQLADKGRLVIPVGEAHQELMKVVRCGDNFTSSSIEAVRFVPLVAGELA
ncbi:protein-L-isoaspartate O-methyltransferase [Vibrio sp. HA2012]|uniref:protein-L-isoaspartate(D-aspartate) O-methyltransferase n=1 Tax=Vibrio sp. HA2012 TaxID=1971595 RepID=UPI000C2BE713|nr:protein-L-isoaspartate(D-aspartate) O-methyltransferase [Vibrio sp. HA2012]PJC86349.1 protein-L-isoaspartate O-methyltransferase [Vibrio sp. HA2012]